MSMHTHTGHTETVLRGVYYSHCVGCVNPIFHQSIKGGAEMMMVVEAPCSKVRCGAVA